ncbi:MAG: hypothetical protein FJX75_28545 [Armatimonadetes bacterium]|nr:hypothetical protein [Armatimonadota bacterium]
MVSGPYRGVWLAAIVVALVAATLAALWHKGRPHGSLRPDRSRESVLPKGPIGGGAPAGAMPGLMGGPPGGGMPGGMMPEGPPGGAIAAECGSHLQRLARAINMYGVDYDDHLPLAQYWCDATYPYVLSKDLYCCPAKPEVPGYAFNRNLSGARTRDLDQSGFLVLLFDSSAGRMNAADTGQSLCRPPRHVTSNSFGDLAGHVIRPGNVEPSALRWR